LNLALLILPFLIVPFLISSTYIDSTLLIKKTSTFVLFLIPSLFFLKSQKNINSNYLKLSYKHIIVLIGFLCINLFISTNYIESIWVIISLLGWISIYMLFSFYGTIKLIRYILYTTPFIASLLSLFLFNDIFNVISLNIPTAGKLSATFGYKNFFAQYLCIALPASFIGFLITKKQKNKFLVFIAFSILLLALFITRTRAAWLGSLLPLIIFAIMFRKNILSDFKIFFNKRIYYLYFIIVSFLFVFIVLKPIDIKKGIWIGDKSSILDTVLSIKDINKKDLWGYRLEMYHSTLLMIKDNPVFGVGLGNWKILYPSYSSNEHLTDDNPYKIVMRPHNDLLWLIAEIGFLGFSLCVFIIYQHFKILIQKIKSSKTNNEKFIYYFILMALSALFIESMFDFPSERVVPNLFFWSMLGFISTNIKRKNKNNWIIIIPSILLLISIVFSFYNLKSHYHAQLLSNSVKKENFDKILYHSNKVKSYYRNTNYLGIPINYYQGIAFYQKRYYNQALNHFNESLKLYPSHLGSMNYMYKIYLIQNNAVEAEKIVKNISDKYRNIKKPQIDFLNYINNN